MDAEERHELKENDLAEFFANFGDWWSKHGNTTLIVVMLAVSTYIGIKIYKSSTQRAHDDAWYDLATSSSPLTLEQVALTYSIPEVRAQANLRAADLFSRESIAPAGEGESDLSPTQKLQQAQTMYQSVLEGAEHPVFRLNALLGLAANAESRQDWDQAKQHYDQVVELAGQSQYGHFAEIAQTRISFFPKLQTPVEFAPDPPASQPAQAAEPAESRPVEALSAPANTDAP